MSLKYDCISQSTWRLAVHSFLRVLRIGLPVVRGQASAESESHGSHETTSPLWSEIILAFDEFLFPKR